MAKTRRGMHPEDLNVLIRLLATAVMVAAFVLGATGCATQAPPQPRSVLGPILLFCAQGEMRGTPGLICADPDTAGKMLQGSPPIQPQRYPAAPSAPPKDTI